jgi:hypothetical protein
VKKEKKQKHVDLYNIDAFFIQEKLVIKLYDISEDALYLEDIEMIAVKALENIIPTS